MYVLLLSLCGGNPDRLGSESWAVREGAESTLRALGWLAMPAVWQAREHNDPEVRARADRLLAPWRRVTDEMRVAAVLLAEAEPNPNQFHGDLRLRFRVHRLLAKAGVPEWEITAIHPSDNPWWQPWGLPAYHTTAESLRQARARVRCLYAEK